MSAISKVISVLSISSAIVDIHKTALIYSKKERSKASANCVLENSIAYQKSDTFSYKDASRKNWLRDMNFLAGIKEIFGSIKGYFKGIAKTSPRYLPNFILGTIGLVSKSKSLATVSAVGLAGLEVYDFIVHSTKLTQKTDYLKVK